MLILRKPLFPSEKKKIREVKIHIFEDICKGCRFCIEYCPKKVLEKSDKLNAKGFYPPYVKNEDDCVGCGLCQAICPDFAIYIEEVDKEGEKKNVA